MSGPIQRTITANGQRDPAERRRAGRGPAVLPCHGFAELSYSGRHQLRGLAAVGLRAVAPDMRGDGRSEAPTEVDQ